MERKQPIRHYKHLLAYEQSYRMVLEVFRLTQEFPRHEQYELGRQLRSSARSVPANIAEGWAKRQSSAEFRRYLQNAIGSCEETQVWLDFCFDHAYITTKQHDHFKAEYAKIGMLLQRLWSGWRKLG